MGDLSKIDWSYYADDRMWESFKPILKTHNDDLVRAYAENPNNNVSATPEVTAAILGIYRIYEDCLSGKKGKGSADYCLVELDRMRAGALRKSAEKKERPVRESKTDRNPRTDNRTVLRQQRIEANEKVRIERIRARQAVAELRIQAK